jgi:hypothetical protein
VINLFLAAVWLGVGVFLIVWQQLHPENRALTIWGSNVSLGWFGLVLALYNIVRWRARKSTQKGQSSMEDALQRRRLPRRPGESGREVSPDPNFDFSDKPPPAQPQRDQ